MLNRLATLAAAAGVLLSATVTPLALADPVDSAGFDGPPPDNGIVGSDDPATITTPDGWVLTVAATNETQLPVAPLTSRSRRPTRGPGR